jgi:CRISPR type II-A-associated protein Csn2
VVIETSWETLLEQLIGYMQVMRQIYHIRIFTIMNLKQYFDETEIQGLYEFTFYEKIYLLVLESKYTECSKNEKCLIMDRDLCIIEAN